LPGVIFLKEQTEVRRSVLAILITPQVMRWENPIPEWPKINTEDNNLAAIMEDTPRTGTSGAEQRENDNDFVFVRVSRVGGISASPVSGSST
jgi:hypothetical protein